MGQVAENAGLVWDEQKQELATAWTCPSGRVCFYSGSAGTGSACSWTATGADDNWLAGTMTCSWSGSDSVESVHTSGTSNAFNGVRYYTA
jgi:hypothetical protein